MILRALEVAAAAAAWLQRALRPTESHTSSPASPPFTCGSGTGSVGTAGGMVSEGADHAAGRCGGKAIGKAGGKAGGRGIPEGGGWESCESSADKKTGSRGAFDGFGVAEGFAAEAEEPRRLFRGSCSGGALACEYYSRSKSSIVVVVVVVV